MMIDGVEGIVDIELIVVTRCGEAVNIVWTVGR